MNVRFDMNTLYLSDSIRAKRVMCLTDAVTLLAGELHLSMSDIVSPVLNAFGTQLSDALPEDLRQMLIPIIPKLVGTASDGQDNTRAFLGLDWLIRRWTSKWIDLAGLTVMASDLRSLAQIDDAPAVLASGLLLLQANTDTSFAWRQVLLQKGLLEEQSLILSRSWMSICNAVCTTFRYIDESHYLKTIAVSTMATAIQIVAVSDRNMLPIVIREMQLSAIELLRKMVLL
jgi:hypothetical protein